MIAILLLGTLIMAVPTAKADTQNANIAPGEYLALIMQMSSGVQLNFTVTSSAYVHVYVLDDTNYNQYRTLGTYSSALYVSALVMTVSTTVTAPQLGKYYVIVANQNSNTVAVVTVDYQFIRPSSSWDTGLIATVLIGGIAGAAAGGIGYLFVRNSRRKKQIPPELGPPPMNTPPQGPSS